jgi:hypothetical protein
VSPRRGVLARWAAHLPIPAKTPALTRGEGDTPLVAAPALARDIGSAGRPAPPRSQDSCVWRAKRRKRLLVKPSWPFSPEMG